jgi:hypothetical protein
MEGQFKKLDRGVHCIYCKDVPTPHSEEIYHKSQN